jgi:NAD-dependent dihydropyrimidine dehydrogenase PreA subunit
LTPQTLSSILPTPERGFISMNADPYEKLAGALDLLPGGFPKTKSGVELKILKRIFSPEEALIASNLTGSSEAVDAIALRTTLPLQEAVKKFKEMLKKGIIWGSKKDGMWRFRLAPFLVGFYEEQWEVMDHELAHLCEQYLNEGAAEGIMRPKPALHRVVPAQQAIKTEFVLPYDDIIPLILQGKFFELRDCICRKQQDLVDNRKCDFPVKACLNFSVKERPVGQHSITKQEALKVLDQAKEIGLVHTVSNVARGVFYVCNCCGCCCGILRGITQFGIEHSVAKANYYAVVDPEQCTGCATCEQRCQVNACSVDEVSAIDLKKCIGCGLCVTGCPNEAMKLTLRPDAEIIHPPENYKAWEQQRLSNRGLLK